MLRARLNTRLAASRAAQAPAPTRDPVRLELMGNRFMSIAERMGYAISILPGLLLGNIIAICDQTLAETKRLGKYPPPLVESSPAKTFARFGAADWDARRTAFRDEIKVAAE